MLLPVLDQNTMRWLEVLSTAVAAIAVIVTAAKFLAELRLGREQRAQDLRWKQAEAGKALNDELQLDPQAWAALQMLDGDGRIVTLPSGRQVAITHEQVRAALRGEADGDSERAVHVRDCFDALFYYFATMHHYAAQGLILRDDVAYPLEYYVPLLARTMRAEVMAYLDRYGLTRTWRFLAAQPAWGDWREVDDGRTISASASRGELPTAAPATSPTDEA